MMLRSDTSEPLTRVLCNHRRPADAKRHGTLLASFTAPRSGATITVSVVVRTASASSCGGAQMFERNVKETFNRRRVEVDRDDPREAAALDEVGDDSRSNGFPAGRPPILTGVAEVGARPPSGGLRRRAGTRRPEGATP